MCLCTVCCVLNSLGLPLDTPGYDLGKAVKIGARLTSPLIWGLYHSLKDEIEIAFKCFDRDLLVYLHNLA